MARLRAYLTANAGWSKADEEALIESCNREIGAAAEAYLAADAQEPGAMFDYLYASPPADVAAQRERVVGPASDA